MHDVQELKHKASYLMVMRYLLLEIKPVVSEKGTQYRAKCPACGGAQSHLVISPDHQNKDGSKGAWYCFAVGRGGDQIALISHVKGCDIAAAISFLAQQLGINPLKAEMPRALAPLTYLQPEHELIQALGISVQTATKLESGYAPRGSMKGYYLVPIFNRVSDLTAYIGLAVHDCQLPRIEYHKDFPKHSFLFNWHEVEEGRVLYLAREPLSAVLAIERGLTNVVSFISEITDDSSEALETLLCEKRIRHLVTL